MSAMLAAGTDLGRYEIRSKIGAGGMGEVYLAQDTELDRTVAIKILPEALASDGQRLQRFVQEAKAASALNHPHILTIYEIGTIENSRFIATEFIDGETLRQRISAGMKLSDILEVAIQAASALAAAHAAGIIHRDIKPENIMVRRDGYIKVLDFGLAKLTHPEGSTTDTEAPTRALVDTGAGTVLGTANYMSPEQAKGKRVDARTDLWALGAVIYEMVAEHGPFEAETPSEVIGLILNKEPPLLARYDREAPQELERIVTKALTKDLEERYQTAKDLLVDLKRLKRRLDLESEIERTVPPEFRTSGSRGVHTGTYAPAISEQITTIGAPSSQVTHQVTSAEYIVSEIKQHKKGFAVTGAVIFALALATVGYFLIARRTAALMDKDAILLADFVNTTGDAVFDGTLKQGLAVQLGQSPFLNLFSDTRVRQTLRLMGHSPDDRVTAEIGREICQRQGLKAFITGSIASLGSHYVLTLQAVNSQNGEVLAREQGEAESKEEVLKTLSQTAIKLREKLGESLNSLQRFDAPLEVTTSSLEALKAYSLAAEQANRGKWIEAMDHYKHALELDPNFASSYSGLGVSYANTNQPKLAGENMAKAYALRDRVSEVERLRITSFYYFYDTGELD